jgi:nucleoside-diphosphate-sugar epimerase
MILVTGGTGFLGSHLLQQLVGRGKEVRCIYRKTILKNVPLETAKYVDWQEADLLDVVSLEEVMKGVDMVCHCAGLVSFDPADRQRIHAVNVTGTANVVNACLAAGIRKLVHVSSVAALGRSVQDAVIDESREWEDSRRNTFYAVSKHLAEMEVYRGMGEGLNAVIVNPSILIGPSQGWGDASAGLINSLYEGFRWYTRGINGFVDVRDVARAMISLMESDMNGERFILNGDNWSYQQLFSAMLTHLGKSGGQKYAAPWMGEIIWRVEKAKSVVTGKPPKVVRETARTASMRVFYSSDKIQKFLPGFAFAPLEETVLETCTAFLRYKSAQQRPAEQADRQMQQTEG